MDAPHVKAEAYSPPIAIPPGETLQEVIEAMRMSQSELALRLGRPPQMVNEIIRGKKAITPDTAIQLEKVTSLPWDFWLSLERIYQATEARLAYEVKLRSQIPRLANFPYSEMVRYGLVPASRDQIAKVKSLLNFLRVANFDALEAYISRSFLAYHQRSEPSLSLEKLAVWLRMGEIEGERIRLQPYSETRLKNALPAIRSLSKESPDAFIPHLKEIGAKCGVAFLFVREFRGFPVYGLTRWISGHPHIQLSLRGKRSDFLWFAIFHEIGHVLLHNKRQAFIDKGRNPYRPMGPLETGANRFAADALIPPEIYARFRGTYRITREQILDIADELDLSPGIIVGRLQHDGLVRFNQFNDLFQRLTWAD